MNYKLQKLCFVNCGLPSDQCDCFREMMQQHYDDLCKGQRPLGEEFARVLDENLEDLYED